MHGREPKFSRLTGSHRRGASGDRAREGRTTTPYQQDALNALFLANDEHRFVTPAAEIATRQRAGHRATQPPVDSAQRRGHRGIRRQHDDQQRRLDVVGSVVRK